MFEEYIQKEKVSFSCKIHSTHDYTIIFVWFGLESVSLKEESHDRAVLQTVFFLFKSICFP